jgi:hypothetical protein
VSFLNDFCLDETGLATMQNDRLGNERRFETAEYWHVRSHETRSRAEQMTNPESRHLMSALADDYERTAHIVEGMASIRGALTSVMASVNGLLSQQ